MNDFAVVFVTVTGNVAEIAPVVLQTTLHTVITAVPELTPVTITKFEATVTEATSVFELLATGAAIAAAILSSESTGSRLIVSVSPTPMYVLAVSASRVIFVWI